ncbi:hypothetical protein [Shumkonia mesophila]|uniref:hypothetical protein n=1 Tax=Shumkonia mesophila TaxID=2838854 RepID=UPI0029342529|nr:hypothetical protein [Shumkonia mesophila]
MAKTEEFIRLDITPLCDAMAELRTLMGDGAGLSERVRLRAERLASPDGSTGDQIAEVDLDGRQVLPGHELLSLLVDLRMARRQGGFTIASLFGIQSRLP